MAGKHQGKRTKLTITGYNLSRREIYARDNQGHEYSITFGDLDRIYSQIAGQVQQLQQQSEQQQQAFEQMQQAAREQAMEVKPEC